MDLLFGCELKEARTGGMMPGELSNLFEGIDEKNI